MKLIVIGAGAAGLMAAGTACGAGAQVTLLEHSGEPGKKLLITGKGRCNVTNNCDERTFLSNIRTNPRFLYSSLYAFPPEAAMAFFEDLGVALKTERGRRVFPVSDKAAEVRQALLRFASGARCENDGAKSLILEDGRCRGVVTKSGRRLPADAVIVATGGLSYPVTGSTGDGYVLARQAGHTIVQPRPSLVALVAQNAAECREMTGLSLKNVTLTLTQNGKKVFDEQGEMLFTHFGISGPLTLSASAYTDDFEHNRFSAVIDLKPALSEKQLYDRITRDFAAMGAKEASNSLDKLLPNAMRPVMLRRWQVDPAEKVGQITKEQKQQLVRLMKGFEIPIAGRGDLDHAIVTRGGVDVKQVNPSTMESRLCPGLYFAGEVLDTDGYTGGYNLHIAWCTGRAAALAAAQG